MIAPSTSGPKKKEIVAFAFKHPVTGKENEKQISFYNKVMDTVRGLSKIKYFFYGGAIRGGKTFVILFILWRLAKLFPGSRWHVIRSTFTELEDTTIPSMEKLIGTHGKDFVWKRKESNYHVHLSNKSKIFFKSENASKDNGELGWMLGLETNGIFLEQMEGLSEKAMSRAIERVGSWYIGDHEIEIPKELSEHERKQIEKRNAKRIKMPPPLIFGSFNPTQNWVKKFIYDRWRNDTLPPDYYFEEALPEDNPFVTQDQWENWNNLDPISKAQMIHAVWRFLTDAKLFAYSFNPEKTVVNVETPEGRAKMAVNPRLPVKIIFDFNVDPITALACQNDGMKWGKIIKEYRLRNSNIFELCERIRTDWENNYIIVSGDASARNRSALTKGNRTYIKTIKALLRLKPTQLQFPAVNPSVRNTRVLLNSLLHRHPEFLISSECLYTIDDLETVKVKDNGEIDKGKDAKKTHLLDNVRYFAWKEFKKFVNTYS